MNTPDQIEKQARVRKMTNDDLWRHFMEAVDARPYPATMAAWWLGTLQAELERRFTRIGFLPAPEPKVEASGEARAL
jgi:hypothetical protein